MRRRKMLLAGMGLIVVALAVAGIAWRRLSVNSSSVSVSAAVSEFQRAANGSVSGPPRLGVYTYALRGNECAGVAGLQLCRAFPSRARMILTRKPGTITIELDLSQEHVEVNRYTVRPDGLYLAWQRTRIVFGIAQENAASTVPTTLALPSALQVGQHWTQRFSADQLPVVATNRVTRHMKMTIGGSAVSVYEIDAISKTSGAHPGTETDVTWHSPNSGLDVRLIMHRKIGGTFPYSMDIDATLLSLKPVK
ncbi:MAG: hypothetical protein JWO42_1895 [Chloroflexi bacterium]|nr:hypothetical protein [Chloroflexota bacterium]